MVVFNNFHNEQILKLDVKQQQPNAIPRIVQYDSALLKIELYDNGVLYDVSRATDFVVSIKRPDGSEVSGLAEYDGEFINYKLTKQDMEQTGEHEARLQVYESRHRLSSLSFRYDVNEDFESVGDPDEQTLLSQLFTQLNDALTEAQRQGNYAENRGDFANDAGDYAMDAGDSQKMRWLMYVNTIEERDQQYPNPQNGDVLYVVNVDGMDGGAVFRYNSIQQPPQWVEIAGYDVSIIQDIYNVLSTKETKAEVKRITDEISENLEALTIGGTNLASIRPEDRYAHNMSIQPTSENVYKGNGIEIISTGADDSTSYLELGKKAEFKRNMKYVATAFVYDPNNLLSSATLFHSDYPFEDVESNIYEFEDNMKKVVVKGTASENVSGSLLLYFETNSTVGATVSAWKIEEGTRPTDWSLSFDDVVRGYSESIGDLSDDLNGKIQDQYAEMELLEDAIRMTVYQEVYNTINDELVIWKSERMQEADQINQTVSKMVGEDEIISKFNQSPETIKMDAKNINLIGDVNMVDGLVRVNHINLSRATVTGANGDSSIMLDNDQFMSHGRFTRTWAGITDTAELNLGINKGRIMISNEETGYNLYMTEKGLSTTMAGAIEDYTAGTIEFHSQRYNTTSRGITIHSTYGAVALESDYSTIYSVSNLTNNIESRLYSVYIRPFKDSRNGLNEFQFYVKDNESTYESDGCLLFGDLTGSQSGGSGIRFSKGRNENVVYATNNNGDIGSGHFHARSFRGDLEGDIEKIGGFAYVRANRLRIVTGEDNQTYSDIQFSRAQADSIRVNNAGANFYIGSSTGETRFTNNLLYNGGDIGYANIRVSNVYTVSSEKYKSDINPWEHKVLDKIKNDVKIYSYKLKEEIKNGIERTHRGLILERETLPEWINGDGVDQYEITTWTLKAVQEVAIENEELKTELYSTKEKMKNQEERIERLEALLL